MIRDDAVPATGPPAATGRLQGPRAFFVVGTGQIFSMFGSELTAFVLGVWLYETTGLATAFSWMALAAALPGVLLSPVAGVLVDRWNRRTVMVLADAGAAVGTVVLIWLAFQGQLAVVWIYLVVAVSAAFGSLQFPAFSAAIPMMVPKDQLGRANGFMEAGTAAARLLAPLTAGFLLAAIGLAGVFTIDLVTFFLALVTLLAVHIPSPRRMTTTTGTEGDKPSLVAEAMEGWHFLRRHPALMTLLLLFLCTNFVQGFVIVLLTPLVLSFASAADLGVVMSVAGLGLFAGGAWMSLTGGPQRRVRAIFVCFALQGSILFLGGVQPSVALVAVAACVYSLCTPVIIALNQSIWQAKVPPAVQGRVFAVRRMVALALAPLAFFIAGPLADGVFEPLLTEGGALAGTVGAWIGTGPGRGIGLMFILLGIGLLVVLALAAGNHRLRTVEHAIPDWNDSDTQ